MASLLPAYRLTVYAHKSIDNTEATVLTPIAGAAHSDPFKVSTITSSGFKVYLDLPAGRRGRIDPLSMKTDVGELTIGILDVRAGAVTDNLTRWMTAFLGDVGDGQQLGGCKAVLEESTNGGSSWANFFVGRIASIKLRGKLWYDVKIRDASENLKGDIFVGRPHPTASYAQLFSLLPVGLLKPYGHLPVTTPLTGTMDNLDSTLNISHITVSNTSLPRLDNEMTVDLWSAVDGYVLFGFTLGASTNPKRFTNTALLHLKRLDTSAEGDFRVGAIEISSALRAVGDVPGPSNFWVQGIFIQPMRYPLGVATGTPLVNNGAGYSAGATSIATDGWTISITGILKQGDIISFASHATRYFVTADTNSNGSGQATVTINPPLTGSVPDNNAITVQQSVGRMALPPNGTSVEFSIVRDARLRDANPNCILVNDTAPGTFWKDILLGYFGQLWNDDDVASGALLPAGANLGDPKRVIPYDSSAFTTLAGDTTIPVFRAPFGKFVAANECIEQVIGQPNGLGYYFNGSGQVVPVDMRFPASLSGVVTLTDDDLDTAITQGWEFDDTASITSAAGTRYREDFVLTKAFGEPRGVEIRHAAVPFPPVVGLPSLIYPSKGLPLSKEFVYENSRGHLFDDRPYEVDAVGLRFQHGELAPAAWGSGFTNRDIWTDRILEGLMRIPQRPFGRGPATIKVRCRRTSNVASTFPGTLHILSFSALPDPATNLRGGSRAVRCLERSERGAGIDFTFLDLGINSTSSAPSLATPAQLTGDTFQGSSDAITLNGSNQSAEVQYAATLTSVGSHPIDASPLWHPAKTIFQSMTVAVRNLPINSRIWWRARTFDLSGVQLPSAWTYPATAFVDLATISAPSAMAVTLITDTTAHLAWTNGASYPLNLYLVTPTTDPLQKIATLAEGTTAWDLSGLTANTNYKVEVRHFRDGGETSGSNATFTTTNSPSTCPAGGRTTILVG